MVMRIGGLLPHRAVVLQSARRPPLEACWTVARMCDEAGLDLWVGDSIVAKPRLEPLTTLAYLAAITQRTRLGPANLVIDTLKRYEAAGVTDLCIRFAGADQ